MSANGLILKYHLTKADGRPVDPEGVYFILKLNSHDAAHAMASIAAARTYAATIAPVMLELAADLLRECDRLDELCPGAHVLECAPPPGEPRRRAYSYEEIADEAHCFLMAETLRADQPSSCRGRWTHLGLLLAFLHGRFPLGRPREGEKRVP